MRDQHTGGDAERFPATPQPAAPGAAGSDGTGVPVDAGPGRRPGRHRRAPGRGRWAAAAGLALVAVLGVGAGLHELEQEPAVTAADIGTLPDPTAAPTTRTPTPAPTKPKPKATAKAGPKPAATPLPAPPYGFALPNQKVSAPVLAMGVRRDGELDVPDSPKTVGWWTGSPPAGARRGTVLAGHVDSKSEGVGAFAALRDVAVGSPVVLTDTFGVRHTYTVAARRTYPKYALPKSVFRADVPLVLITCGGPFDEETGRYRDNIVVYATLS